MATSQKLAAFTLDDFEVRTGSATSIVRTIAGLYLRHQESPVARLRIVELAVTAGISAPAAQTAVSRLLDRGLLKNIDASNLEVTQSAQAMFARGTRRIFTPRQMVAGDQWCLVTCSLPESMRAIRHQLRKHFGQLGGGLVTPGLWIFPEYLRTEATEVLLALGIRGYSTLFTTDTPHFADTAQQAACTWWDLTRLEKLHTQFLAFTAPLALTVEDAEHSYRSYVLLIDAWRALPYLDPGLPQQMLPEGWPGLKSRERFLTLSEVHRQAAADHASKILAAGS